MLNKLYSSFFKFEEEYFLFDCKFNGVYFWERVRTLVLSTLKEKLIRADTTDVPDIQNKSTWKIALSALLSIKKNPFFSRQKDVLFVGTWRRQLMDDGLWWDIYIDPILENFDKSHTVVEVMNWGERKTPIRTKNLKIFDSIEVLGLLKRKIGLDKIKLTISEISFLKILTHEIRERFGRRPSKSFI